MTNRNFLLPINVLIILNIFITQNADCVNIKKEMGKLNEKFKKTVISLGRSKSSSHRDYGHAVNPFRYEYDDRHYDAKYRTELGESSRRYGGSFQGQTREDRTELMDIEDDTLAEPVNRTQRRSGSSDELMGIDDDTIAFPVDRDEPPRFSRSQSVRTFGGSSDIYPSAHRRAGTKASAAWSMASNSSSTHGTASNSSSKAHITQREKDNNGRSGRHETAGGNTAGTGSGSVSSSKPPHHRRTDSTLDNNSQTRTNLRSESMRYGDGRDYRYERKKSGHHRDYSSKPFTGDSSTNILLRTETSDSSSKSAVERTDRERRSGRRNSGSRNNESTKIALHTESSIGNSKSVGERTAERRSGSRKSGGRNDESTKIALHTEKTTFHGEDRRHSRGRSSDRRHHRHSKLRDVTEEKYNAKKNESTAYYTAHGGDTTRKSGGNKKQDGEKRRSKSRSQTPQGRVHRRSNLRAVEERKKSGSRERPRKSGDRRKETELSQRRSHNPVEYSRRRTHDRDERRGSKNRRRSQSPVASASSRRRSLSSDSGRKRSKSSERLPKRGEYLPISVLNAYKYLLENFEEVMDEVNKVNSKGKKEDDESSSKQIVDNHLERRDSRNNDNRYEYAHQSNHRENDDPYQRKRSLTPNARTHYTVVPDMHYAAVYFMNNSPFCIWFTNGDGELGARSRTWKLSAKSDGSFEIIQEYCTVPNLNEKEMNGAVLIYRINKESDVRLVKYAKKYHYIRRDGLTVSKEHEVIRFKNLVALY